MLLAILIVLIVLKLVVPISNGNTALIFNVVLVLITILWLLFDVFGVVTRGH